MSHGFSIEDIKQHCWQRAEEMKNACEFERSGELYGLLEWIAEQEGEE